MELTKQLSSKEPNKQQNIYKKQPVVSKLLKKFPC